MISKRITIIGAGLSGSLLAILLSKEGYEVEMYERREDLRNGNITGGRSINLALSHRGIKALEQIGIMDEINKIVVPVTGRIIHNINGEISYQPYGKDKTEFNLSISRADLNIKLLDFAEKNNVKIYFNHNCRKYTPKTNELMIENDSDGTKLQLFPDVIIGTDGSSSAIRKSIINLGRFNYSQTYLDHGYKELEIPAGPDNSFRMDKNGLHIWPRGEFMLIALPNTDGSFTCTLFFPHNGDISFDSLTTPEKVNQLFNEYFPDVIDKMPNLTSEFFINPTGRLLTIKSDPWYYEDKLILLGDASHAIVPFYGQGMNSAFEDCMSLIHHLKEYRGDWDQIFKEVYKDRKPN
ncbi:MAG: FAD-dependent monooxygenase, partial [Candidatus Heimdallarchaeota archaeon]|nr:FAD-dependent monooxygenase [Candidatus Heimdallarchaeota archaeon]